MGTENPRQEIIHKTVFLVTAFITVLVLVCSLKISGGSESSWVKFAFLDQLVTLFLLFVFYKAKDYLNLKTYTIVIGCLFLILHNVGSLGPYGWTIWLFRYDRILHFMAGALLFFIFYEFFIKSFEHGKHIHEARTLLLAMLCAMGIGAFTEILEYIVGYFYNNPGVGFFFYGVGDIGEWNDSIFDMFSNFLGTLLGISINFLRQLKI